MIFLIVGGGSIGQRHLSNLKKIGYDSLFCFKRNFSIDFERKFHCKVLTQIIEVKSLIPDIIIVCNPTSLHVKWVDIANELGSHVFVEKPLTHSKEQLDYIKNKWESKSVFFIGFMMRYHPLVKKIKELIDNDIIGKIYSARLEFGSWLPFWHPLEDYRLSYASKKDLGGGVINTITHELDLAQYFFGNPKKVKSVKSNFNLLRIEVEELAESILIYDDKLVSLHVDYLQKDYDRNIKILGEKGRIIWDWHTNEVIVGLHKQDNMRFELKSFDVNQLYIEEIKHFIKIIEEGISSHDLDFKHAISNTELMLEIHKEN
jgi:predicted dehydrogenase